jgi:hypothetical protein
MLFAAGRGCRGSDRRSRRTGSERLAGRQLSHIAGFRFLVNQRFDVGAQRSVALTRPSQERVAVTFVVLKGSVA